MSLHLSYLQKEILNLIGDIQSESDLKEIKSLLLAYFADKTVREADAALDEKQHTAEVFEKWKNEHFRKRA